MYQLPFYPKLEHGCPHVKHCPHLGGASLGTLVLAARDHSETFRLLHRQLDAERERNDKLSVETERLEKKVEELQLELRLERQNKFATNKQKEAAGQTDEPAATAAKKKRKCGAPKGHPGWHRKTPTEYNVRVDVPVPKRCPHCQSANISAYTSQSQSEHLQEDIIDGQYHVTLFVHPKARCRSCRGWVQQAGKGEILGSQIGPHVRAIALYLRNEIGVTYRKVPRAIRDLLGLSFTPGALIGFEKMFAESAKPVVADIEKKIASTEGPVHADETYWTLDGDRAYYWVHTTLEYVHFEFETTRAGQVSRDILGEDFAGTLVTDCYSGYEAQSARAKQKCLAHLARTARDWQKLVKKGSADFKFFERIKVWVKRGCRYHKHQSEWTDATRKKHVRWLEGELQSFQRLKLKHEKAITLQGRIAKHSGSWLVFVTDPRVPPTNNLAERTLRPLVIMRKICFGNRSREGGKRMARIMSFKETARRHGHNPLDLFYHLLTQPPDQVMRHLYKKASPVKT
jgi:hypothetical protein